MKEIVANKLTKEFCRESCVINNNVNIKELILYKNSKEAILNGYFPCNTCDPLKTSDAPSYIHHGMSIFKNAGLSKLKDYEFSKNNIEPEKLRKWFQDKHDLTFQDYMRITRVNMQFPPINIYELDTNINNHTIVINRIENVLGVWLVGATEKGICLLQSMEKRMLETQLLRLEKYFKAKLIPGNSPYFIQLKNEFD